jgi:hypothetical protein
MNDISFMVEESYRKVGFSTHDDFTITVSSLTRNEAEVVREFIIKLAGERR